MSITKANRSCQESETRRFRTCSRSCCRQAEVAATEPHREQVSWLARRAGNDFSRRQLLEPIRERRGSNKNPSPPSESPRSGKLARRYLQRQQLLDLGAAALAYLTELT